MTLKARSLTFHDEDTVVSWFMVQNLKKTRPFRSPLCSAVTPFSVPFTFTPWVPDQDKPFALIVHRLQDRISVRRDQPMYCADHAISFATEVGEVATEKMAMTDLNQQFIPEFVGIKDILEKISIHANDPSYKVIAPKVECCCTLPYCGR